MNRHPIIRKSYAACLFVVLFLLSIARAQQAIPFVEQRLENGLTVLYAPLHQAPVVHVRVLYHVGSRDERPDRRGFAHMFEHMMFRGSAHVGSEEHGKLISSVGGYSNAFTSFDQTVYVNTVPANQVDLALYLEADRMASFKVSDQIYQVERNVVTEEWRRQQNAPYGNFYQYFSELMFKVHPYRWTPIGDMDHLRAATAPELQEFFNRYYVPNNAVLVIAGDIDVDAAKAAVKKYFAWIPKGADVVRNIPAEPGQTEARSLTVHQPVPISRMMIAFRTPAYGDDDHYALGLLGNILAGGSSSRLDRALVTADSPLCRSVSGGDYSMEDAGYFSIHATVLKGKDPQAVRKVIFQTIAQLIEKGTTPEELEKAKVQERVEFVRACETAEKVASHIGQETLLTGKPDRVNTYLQRLKSITVADVNAMAKKYLKESTATMLNMEPEAPGASSSPTTAPISRGPESVAPPASKPVAPRAIAFPANYPAKAPVADAKIRATFAKGEESADNSVKVIVMPDHRLPFVSWTLVIRAGSHSDPSARTGLADLTAHLMRRGAGSLGYDQLNEDLESRGITISVNDGGDNTRINGSCLSDQLEHGLLRTREILLSPALDAREFDKLKVQTLNSLRMAEASPETPASRWLASSLYGDSPLGRSATPDSVGPITLDDIKACYQRIYKPGGAILVIAGDVTTERGRELAHKLLDGWKPAAPESAQYNLPADRQAIRIILVDRPEGKQSLIRMGARSYDLNAADEKFAGSLANTILSGGIDARLGKYVRAEKGLVYSVWGVFQPNRQAGQFRAGAETKLSTTSECVEAILKVFADTAANGITPDELNDAKLRTVGSMVMGMQTIHQQANYRIDGILNNYPIDYYDRYPEHVTAVNDKQVVAVVGKYLKPDRMTVVVVAPAADVKAQLEKLGQVEVVPMPGR